MEALWRLLEDRRSIAAIYAEWRSWLGADLPLVKRWLRRREQLARSMPKSGWRRHRIVTLDDDTIVAVDDESGETASLCEENLVVYELALGCLTVDMTAALELDGQPEQLERGLHRLGVHLSVGGRAIPVFFGFAESAEALLALASRSAARESSPFFLITPTMQFWNESLRALLRSRGCNLLAMRQVLSVGANGFAVVAGLDSLAAATAPNVRRSAASGPRFPTPPRSVWRDVRIKFLDGETVSVTVGSSTQRYSFIEMGLAHPRSKKPTVLWTLLRDLARASGHLTWTTHGASRKIPKRIERLSNALRAFLSISGDPLPLDASKKGYRAVFQIEPD